MRAIRRIYFYLVSFISILTLVWGITNLLRSIANRQTAGDQSTILSAGLAQILVSIPIFLLHWLIVQRDARKSEEEKNSLVRALFFYAILISTLIPVVQNFMALLNRLLLQGVRLNPQRAVFGGNQSLSDNLIAVVVNLILAVYFFRVLRSEWATSTDTGNLVDLRRLYRYVWMLYSLGLTILGVQKLTAFILVWQQSIGTTGKEQLGNAVTLLIVGVPLWVYWWGRIQASINVDEERHSTLRTIILYLLSLTGAITFSVNAGVILHWLLRVALGDPNTFTMLLTRLSQPISLALPFGVIWAYFAFILEGDIASEIDEVKRPAMRRLYRYILSAIGLGGTIYGLAGTAGFIVNLLTRQSLSWQDKHQYLAANLAVLLVGVVLWLVYWLKVNRESMLEGVMGDHARRSLSRKSYLYLVVFACVIGTMASTGYLLYRLLQSIFGSPGYNLLTDSLQNLRLILIFASFLAYHLTCLNRDNRALTRHLAEKQAAFTVIALFDPESSIGTGIQQAFQRHAGSIPIRFILPTDLQAETLAGVGAVILESDTLLQNGGTASEILKGYPGKKIVLPSMNDQYLWISSQHKLQDIYKGCALASRAMAEGQPIKPVSTSSAWLIISYIIAGVVGLEILAVLISLFLGG